MTAEQATLIQRLRLHLSRLGPHQRIRAGGLLLVECLDLIERLEAENQSITKREARCSGGKR